MSSCEKCWADAQGEYVDVSERYRELVKSRQCTAEEQAGPDANECHKCKRMTLHQHTGEPMCGCKRAVANGEASR